MTTKDHWEQVYLTKSPEEVSWFQTLPATSLGIIESSGSTKDGGIIDVGGGASSLVDSLLYAGYTNLAVLDISAAALDHAKRRLDKRSRLVDWFACDVTTFTPPRPFKFWHDRAVFHFLTEEVDRRRYLETMKRTLTPDGHAMIATFALDGPSKCSGLPVSRYDASMLCAELGPEFHLLEQANETHSTPWNTEQRFTFFHFARW